MCSRVQSGHYWELCEEREREGERTRSDSQEGKGMKGVGNQNGELRVYKPVTL